MKSLILLLVLVLAISVQAMKLPLVLKMKINRDCEGTLCPGGCCPYEDWFCCPDMLTCAESEFDC